MIAPTLTARQKADQFLSDFLAHIALRQDTYFATHGRYFQGLSTHITPPEDGVEEAIDTAVKPTDQEEDWDDAGFFLPSSLPCAVSIHVYEGPQGHGFEVELKVIENSKKYRRVEATGPEAQHRDAGWLEEAT